MTITDKDRAVRLARSKFRSRFKLDAKDKAYLERTGLTGIECHAKDFIQKRLAPAHPVKDGKQTPFRGHPVFSAQHATATCCRGCLEKWYGIPKGRELTGEQTEKIVAVIMNWIKNQTAARPT